MRIIPLPNRPGDWDERIRGYPTKTLFHESAWHAHLLDIHRASAMEYFEIADGGEPIGYFCAQRVRKLVFAVCGSPMPGTGTNYMGPVVPAGTEQQRLLQALVAVCHERGFHHAELSHEWLDPTVMRESSFEVHERMTHVVPLPSREAEAWDALTSPCRNRVRKAQKAGLVAEATDDPAIADRYYEQFLEVYGKQGMVAPYGIDRPRSLVARLGPSGRLLAVWVRHKGEVLATGLFPFDEHCVYFWGGASWLRHQHLCPNELLHWTMMQLAIARGIPRYDMCGGGSQFKSKFGGTDVPHYLYNRSFIPLFALGRRLYTWWHWRRLRLAALFRPPDVPRRERVG